MGAEGIISSLSILVIVFATWGIIQMRATGKAYQLLDRQRQDVLAILSDRDGWRELAMRATLIAESSQDTGVRAIVAVEKIVAAP